MESRLALAGIEQFSFMEYWSAVKNRLNELRSLPAEFFYMKNKLMQLKSRAQYIDEPQGLTSQIDKNLREIDELHSQSIEVKSTIDKWLSKWVEAEEAETHPLSYEYKGLGLGPAAIVILGVAGTSAVYFVYKSIDLIAKRNTYKETISLLERGIISAEQAAGIFKRFDSESLSIGSTLMNLLVIGGIVIGSIYALPKVIKGRF